VDEVVQECKSVPRLDGLYFVYNISVPCEHGEFAICYIRHDIESNGLPSMRNSDFSALEITGENNDHGGEHAFSL
jgi:hypothetical protein